MYMPVISLIQLGGWGVITANAYMGMGGVTATIHLQLLIHDWSRELKRWMMEWPLYMNY